MKKTATLFVFIFISFNLLAQTKTLIKNIFIFNGIDNKIIKANLLVEGQLIKKIDSAEIKIDSKNTQVIDGTGKYLMPGLIDAHAHLLLESMPLSL